MLNAGWCLILVRPTVEKGGHGMPCPDTLHGDSAGAGDRRHSRNATPCPRRDQGRDRSLRQRKNLTGELRRELASQQEI